MRDAFPIVALLGDRLARQRHGWRDIKALIVLVAEAGDWNGAAALADALGVHPDQQEAIYHEVTTGAGATTPPRRTTPPHPPHPRGPPMTDQPTDTKTLTVPDTLRPYLDPDQAPPPTRPLDDLQPMARARVLNRMLNEVAAVNAANGWHEEPRSIAEDVALLHSEVSELLEAYRDHGMDDATDPLVGIPVAAADVIVPKPQGVGSEAADVLIRLLDLCYRHNINLPVEYERKLAYNQLRGWRHGSKRL